VGADCLCSQNRKVRGNDDFEIIFVSGDNDEGQFQEYYGHMPWLTIPYGDARLEELNSKFKVRNCAVSFLYAFKPCKISSK
jgi:hypothetical protein